MGAKMYQSTVSLTQSRYYSPCLNAAIFDGPVRLYFAQSQEPDALKIYFQLQKVFDEQFAAAKRELMEQDQSLFILLYPNSETFESSSSGHFSADGVLVDQLGSDLIMGVQGPASELEFVRIQDGLFRIFNSQPVPAPFYAQPL
jgi:hypothetical protein